MPSMTSFDAWIEPISRTIESANAGVALTNLAITTIGYVMAWRSVPPPIPDLYHRYRERPSGTPMEPA
jgi:hypothetical protein